MDATKAHRIFLLEGKVNAKPVGYDHVFSFFYNPADSFLQNYVAESYVHALYDDEFQRMVDFLERRCKNNSLRYRGVDLLWSYKKVLIEFAFYVRYHIETLKRLMSIFPNAHFYISDRNEIAGYPSLSATVRENQAFTNSKRIHLVNESAKLFLPASPPRPLQLFLSHIASFFQLGDFKNAQVAVFSDFEKSKAVLSLIRETSPVMFCNTIAPRTVLRAIKYRFGLWQSAYNTSRNGLEYGAKAERLMSLLQDRTIFDGYHFSDTSISKLLNNELKRLFAENLPKLLFEIDAMYKFFDKMTSLKRVLVDEDASPAKSAFCQVAREYHVLSFVECHGAMSRKNGVLPISADKILVWGAAQKGKLITWGCPPHHIIVTGCSRYAVYQQMNFKTVRQRVAKQLGFSADRPFLLFAPPSLTIGRGHWFLEEKIYKNILLVLEALGEFLYENPKAQLVLKIHAGDGNVSLYKEWARKHQNYATVRIIEKFDPLLLAKAVDFLVVYSSTYAVEGFALGKPVLYLFPDDDQMITEMREYGVFLYPRDMLEMKDIMRSLLKKKWQLPPRWHEARKACLNESSVTPASIIARLLKGVDMQGGEPLHV